MDEVFGGHFGLWWKFFLEIIRHWLGVIMSLKILIGLMGMFSVALKKYSSEFRLHSHAKAKRNMFTIWCKLFMRHFKLLHIK